MHQQEKKVTSLDPQAYRSWVMRRVLSRGNCSTERRFQSILRANKFSGWSRSCGLLGKPDFVFKKNKAAIFIDGCFWHGCPKCFRLPKQNRAFWKAKIEKNKKRDRSVNGRLRRLGWKVLRIRECKLKSNKQVLGRLNKVLSTRAKEAS